MKVARRSLCKWTKFIAGLSIFSPNGITRPKIDPAAFERKHQWFADAKAYGAIPPRKFSLKSINEKMMTQKRSHLFRLLLVFSAAVLVFSCKKSDAPPAPKPPVISYNQKIVSVNVGQTIPTLVPDSSKGGSVTQYSVYPGLPKGISLNQVNGTISGTPSDSLNPTRFVITAYGPAGMGHDTITIAVGTVGFIYGTTGNYTFTIGSNVLATTPLAPTVLAGNFKKFFIDPNTNPNDLTSTTGLTFDETTGKISGTPRKLTSTTEVPGALTFVITAITQDNKAAYDTIHITVNDVAPVVSYTFRGAFAVGVPVGTALPPVVTLVPGTNYGTVIKYRLAPGSPALPDSLVLDSLTGKITGTPAPEDAGTTNLVIRAYNTGGYYDITLPLVIDATAVAPQVKYFMSFLSSDIVDTICPAIVSGGTVYLTKKDTSKAANTAGVPTIYLNPYVLAGQPGTFSITPTGDPLTLTSATGMLSGTPAATATTPYAATLNIANLQPGNPNAGSFAVTMVSNVEYFNYNNQGVGGLLANYYEFLKNQPVDQAVTGTGAKYPGYPAAALTPTTGGGVTSFAIYPMSSTTPAFASTGLSFNSTTGTISGTPTIDSNNGTTITASWGYLVVGTKSSDGSFTIYKINVKIYPADAGWGQ
jgi:hypothetical protein